MQGARIICSSRVTIGDYAMISWKVPVMDSYRWPRDAVMRRSILQQIDPPEQRRPPLGARARDVIIGIEERGVHRTESLWSS